MLSKIYAESEERLKLTVEDYKLLYEHNIISIDDFYPNQCFAYKIAELSEIGLCKLSNSKWINGIDEKWFGKPKIKTEKNKWGDLMDIDGSHKIEVIKYQVKITVNYDSMWFFDFDENNEKSINSFYKTFEPYLFNAYFNVLAEKRINELVNSEVEKLINININLKK